MTLRRIKLPGRKHPIPSDLAPFVKDLEKVAKTQIGFGEFSWKGSTKRNIELRHYDEGKKTLTLRVNSPDYLQVLHLRVEPDSLKEINDFVTNYKF